MSNHIYIIYTIDSQVKEKQDGKATKKSSHKFDFFHSITKRQCQISKK